MLHPKDPIASPLYHKFVRKVCGKSKNFVLTLTNECSKIKGYVYVETTVSGFDITKTVKTITLEVTDGEH